jgi:hypothetical protein
MAAWEDFVYVADAGNRRVQRFAGDGTYQGEFATRDVLQPDHFLIPRAIAVGPSGQVFVGFGRDDTYQVHVYDDTSWDGWRIEAFEGAWLTGAPRSVALAPAAHLSWRPEPGFEAGESARFENELELSPGLHEFSIRASGGAHVWLDKTLVFDRWSTDAISEVIRLEVNPRVESPPPAPYPGPDPVLPRTTNRHRLRVELRGGPEPWIELESGGLPLPRLYLPFAWH